MNEEIRTRRVHYGLGALDAEGIPRDPFEHFVEWLGEALRADAIGEANAMTVATVGADGRPSARVVLLRGWDRRGVVFYTNYESRKAAEIIARPFASAVFWWGALERQIRIEGTVERVSADESDAYFATRPRGHRIGAWASRQSEIVVDRAALERAVAEIDARFPGEVPRPPFWGGFRIVPDRFEFWQGRPNRIHDRIAYVRDGETWALARLAP
jgi:pyridoxamine 5'-phosphate oxidase